MHCYVYGKMLEADSRTKRGIVAFAVPDLGILFKSNFSGWQIECEYMALLTFLRFVEKNPKVFAHNRIEILSSSASLVFDATGKAPRHVRARKFKKTVEHFRKKIPFSLHWIAEQDNPTLEGVFDLPPLSSPPAINHPLVQSPDASDRKPGAEFGQSRAD